MSQLTDPGPGEETGPLTPETTPDAAAGGTPEPAAEQATPEQAAPAAAEAVIPSLMAPSAGVAVAARPAPGITLTRTQTWVGAIVALVLIALLTFFAGIVVGNHVGGRHGGAMFGRMSHGFGAQGGPDNRGFGLQRGNGNSSGNSSGNGNGFGFGFGSGNGHGHGNSNGRRVFPQLPNLPRPSGSPSASSS